MKKLINDALHFLSNITISTKVKDYVFVKQKSHFKEDQYIYKNGFDQFSIETKDIYIIININFHGKTIYRNTFEATGGFTNIKMLLKEALPSLEEYLLFNESEKLKIADFMERSAQYFKIQFKSVRYTRDNEGNEYILGLSSSHQYIQSIYRKFNDEWYVEKKERFFFSIPSNRLPMDLNDYLSQSFHPQKFNNVFDGYSITKSFKNIDRDAHVFQISIYNKDLYNFYYIVDNEKKLEEFYVYKNKELVFTKDIDGYFLKKEFKYNEDSAKLKINNFYMKEEISKMILDCSFRYHLNSHYREMLAVEENDEITDEAIEMIKLTLY